MRGLLRLSNDTIVDHILNLLSIKDVLRLRPVCRLLYELTHQPSVWKRFLRSFPLPLPPLPPSTRYSLPSLSSFETERLLLRALSADANWRSKSPRPYHIWKCPAWCDVLHIKMLAGGKHMVVSVRNGPNSYELMLFMMDHRVKVGFPVASFRVPSKAYKIEAKYIQYGGEMGILIAFLRREAAHKRDRMNSNINVSEFSDEHNIDFPVPVRYELSVLHAKLSSLDVVEDPRYPPGSEDYRPRMAALPQPLEVVTALRSNTAYDFLDIDEIDGDPHLICTQGRCIITKNLTTKWISRFRCAARVGYEAEAELDTHAYLPFRIRAIRILPPQRELLVVVTDDSERMHPLFLELYNIPSDGEMVFIPASSPPSVHPRTFIRLRENSIYSDIRISNHGLPLPHGQAVVNPHTEPPPLSIFCIAQPEFIPTHPTPQTNPWRALQLRLWPERVAKADARALVPPPPRPDEVPLSETTFRFRVHDARWIHRSGFGVGGSPTAQTLRFLPGTARALLYSVDAHDRSVAPRAKFLYAYVGPEPPLGRRPNAVWPEDEEARAARASESGLIAQAMGVRTAPTAALSVLRRNFMTNFVESGLVAIEWEDWSGKLCMVNAKEPETLYMVEYAMQPEELPDGNRRPAPVPDVDMEFR